MGMGGGGCFAFFLGSLRGDVFLVMFFLLFILFCFSFVCFFFKVMCDCWIL